MGPYSGLLHEDRMGMAKFLTSARAVDMLGRQQIAGIPTAISEIFKNAYDAYSRGVRGDYFPSRAILAIRDDGIGMDFRDFTERWLTIGTDSKARDSSRPLPPTPVGFKPRRPMGEKGIGRLAIASVGPQMLLVTRARNKMNSPEDEWIVALLQWSLFEVPGLTLDDVVIPVRRVKEVAQLNSGLLHELATEVSEAIDSLGNRISAERQARIHAELKHLSFDPMRILRLNGPDLMATGGTAFIVAPVNEDLESVVSTAAAQENEFLVSPFQRFLMGFTNSITPDVELTDFVTEFILHKPDGPVDLIDPTSFWSPEDFANTDHTVEGDFDEYGTFRGAISIYGGPPISIVEPWTENRGNRTSCGPFTLKFGYVQGEQTGSRLSAEDFALMTARLQRLGGLYVYRDGIRVLPYGNSDTDYLEIEQRRTLNAGRYYFSYRRIFGAISLGSASNPGLQEKAGREGFRENAAYRDFTGVLKSFLVQLAASFFSGATDDSDEFRRQRDRLKDRSRARNVSEQKERESRQQLSRQIKDKLNYFESGRFSTAVQEIAAEALDAKPNLSASDDDIVSRQRKAVERFNNLLDEFDVSKPHGLGLTADQDREFSAYLKVQGKAVETVTAAVSRLERSVWTFTAHENGGLHARQRIAHFGAQQLNELEVAYEGSQQAVRKALVESQAAALKELGEFGAFLDEVIDSLTENVAPSKELRVLADVRRQSKIRKRNLQDLSALIEAISDSGSFVDDRVALQERVLDLQEQNDANLELMQLGQAVQIVSHEFEASIRSVRLGLQKLSPWARSTPRLAPIVGDLRASFSHLDGYLRLFTPLQRRLYRQKVVITGAQVSDFVSGVFFDRFQRHAVKFVVTERFMNWRFEGYPSTFYPVFVNLIDNAVSWANEGGRQAIVTLDADEKGLLVRDNGPGVRIRDREAIFERGFTRRRGGRGLGLSISQDLLARDGWQIELDMSSSEGAVFRVHPIVSGSMKGSA